MTTAPIATDSSESPSLLETINVKKLCSENTDLQEICENLKESQPELFSDASRFQELKDENQLIETSLECHVNSSDTSSNVTIEKNPNILCDARILVPSLQDDGFISQVSPNTIFLASSTLLSACIAFCGVWILIKQRNKADDRSEWWKRYRKTIEYIDRNNLIQPLNKCLSRQNSSGTLPPITIQNLADELTQQIMMINSLSDSRSTTHKEDKGLAWSFLKKYTSYMDRCESMITQLVPSEDEQSGSHGTEEDNNSSDIKTTTLDDDSNSESTEKTVPEAKE